MENKVWEGVGLTKGEYDKILEILGREPNELELNMYGVMWSEHCSYKNSKPVLRLFPTKGARVLQGPGENAGIVDIGDNLAIAMKIESHNHPSAIEPFQGAATGVGGIIRDIFTMGARPIALLNSLRFGELEEDSRAKELLEGVVSGISFYGNCIGIPTVGGEVNFSKSYSGNPLVNAMCVGLIEHDKIIRGKAAGVGNSIMYVGAATGRDGMGGASFASVELTQESEEKRSAVQVGDPFMEKLLLEACLELLATGCVVGIQDLGAAGLTSASSETASRGGTGMIIDTAMVPRREEGMIPVEVMISESQERMLAIVEKGREEEVNRIFKKWGLHSAVIGQVTDDGLLTIKENGAIVGQMPAKSLADDGPVYHREAVKPKYMENIKVIDSTAVKCPEDMNNTLLEMLASTNICSKEWVYKQYDYMVRTSTVVIPGGDAAVVRIRGTKKGISLTTDCNSRYCYLDPSEGGKITIAEAARNIAATGATPLAVTDGLNFGNPEKPEIFWQFRECVLGMSEACRALDTPVISGNVSFYNETDSHTVNPTPMVGMVGLIEDIDKVCTTGFKNEGDLIILLGQTKEEIGGSEYLKVIHNMEDGKIPSIDLELENSVQKTTIEGINSCLIKSAHDCSDGGLLVAIAEKSIASGLGAQVSVETDLREDIYLYSESQSRFVVTVAKDNLDKFKELVNSKNIPYTVLGEVKGSSLKVTINNNKIIDLSVSEMEKRWREALSCIMKKN